MTHNRTRRIFRCRAYDGTGTCRHTRLYVQLPAARRFVDYWHGRGYRVTVERVQAVEWEPMLDLAPEVAP